MKCAAIVQYTYFNNELATNLIRRDILVSCTLRTCSTISQNFLECLKEIFVSLLLCLINFGAKLLLAINCCQAGSAKYYLCAQPLYYLQGIATYVRFQFFIEKALDSFSHVLSSCWSK